MAPEILLTKLETRSDKNNKNKKSNRIIKWVVSLMALIIILQYFFTIGFNVTDSIPKKIFLIIKGTEPDIGDYVAFRFHGSTYYHGGKTFIKILAGKEGDEIETNNKKILLNHKQVAVAKDKDSTGREIDSLHYKGKIPQGTIFVLGISENSYDSRYFGFIDKEQIIGRAIALF